MSLDLLSVTVASLSGEPAWGPGLIDGDCTAGELCCRILRETPSRPRNACPNLLRGDAQLAVQDRVIDHSDDLMDTARAEMLLHVLWSPAKWPIDAGLLGLLLEPILESFLEKPPRWKSLKSASAKNTRGFARGFLKNVEQGKGLLEPRLLLDMLGLPEELFLDLPDVYKQRLERLAEGKATTEDKNEASLAVMIESICALARDPHNAKRLGVSYREAPRKLRSWPTRRDLRKAVALLVAAQLWEPVASELGIRTDDVIRVASGLFTGTPDFAQIRRSMLEFGVLRQRSISPSNFELDDEWAQKCLEDVLGLTVTDTS